MIVKEILNELALHADVEKAAFLQRYFKTGKGQYGEGDIFRGIRIPELRKLGKKYQGIALEDARCLLESPYHEDRVLALIILVLKFSKGDGVMKDAIYALYLANRANINNWDLVDISAEHIVGGFLWDKDRTPLTGLAKSGNLWERRIAIMATFHFIRKGQFDETFRIALLLLNDREDLIHKAVGWMLREIGNRDVSREERFLQDRYRQMPRTMLRYAIEKFPEAKRQAYLKGTIPVVKPSEDMNR